LRRPQLTLWLGLNLVILHIYLPMKMEQSVPEDRHIKFRPRGITQKKAYNIQNTAKFEIKNTLCSGWNSVNWCTARNVDGIKYAVGQEANIMCNWIPCSLVSEG
jgi:hypothetical protein